MPSRPRFSEMLLDRRRQLGLTVGQASQVLKLKEQVLIAFEEGDFENIPQSGYAQGMLSSYARYLGLNPREIVDLFQEELYEHVHGTSSHELRRRTRDTQSGRGVQGYDVVNEAESRPKAYVQYRGLLPTSGGPAGDMGAFATTSGPRPRTPSSVPLAGSSYPAGSRSQSPSYSHAEYVYGRPYNSTSERERDDSRERDRDRYASRQRGRYAQQRRRVDDPANRLLREGQNGVEERRETARAYRRDTSRAQRLYERDSVSTRSVRAGEYTDDLRYDDGARPYDRASTISGRRSSRNIASVDRPKVRRRDDQRGRLSGRARGRASQDNRRTTLLVICALALALTLILVFSVRSCVSNRSTSQENKTTVPVSTTSTDSSSTNSTSTDTSSTPTTTTTTQGTASSDTTASDSTTTTETDVTVSVASGETSWLEITNDGTSEVASTVTGPWEQTYTVTDSITIRAGNPGAVTVTENGTQKSFDSKASGIGSLTIQGTPAATIDGRTKDSTTGTTGDSSSSTSTTSSTGSTSTSGSRTSGGTTSTSSKTSGTTSTSTSN